MQKTRSTESEKVPGKAISVARDKMQSRLLVGLCGCSLLVTGYSIFVFVRRTSPGFAWLPFVIALGFAALVYALRSATLGGSIAGAMVCFNLIAWTAEQTRNLNSSIFRSALTPLTALFVITWACTRTKRSQKEKAGLAEPRHGRTAAQVFANLATAALIITWLGAGLFEKALHLQFPFSYFASLAACLAALAEATADTVSSELGQVFGGAPFLITSFKRVSPGTDGAISLNGTLAGILGAIAVTAAGWWALRLTPQLAGIALAAALIGFLADTLIGATIECRGLLGNDWVNFLSTLIAALTAATSLHFIH